MERQCQDAGEIIYTAKLDQNLNVKSDPEMSVSEPLPATLRHYATPAQKYENYILWVVKFLQQTGNKPGWLK